MPDKHNNDYVIALWSSLLESFVSYLRDPIIYLPTSSRISRRSSRSCSSHLKLCQLSRWRSSWFALTNWTIITHHSPCDIITLLPTILGILARRRPTNQPTCCYLTVVPTEPYSVRPCVFAFGGILSNAKVSIDLIAARISLRARQEVEKYAAATKNWLSAIGQRHLKFIQLMQKYQFIFTKHKYKR